MMNLEETSLEWELTAADVTNTIQCDAKQSNAMQCKWCNVRWVAHPLPCPCPCPCPCVCPSAGQAALSSAPRGVSLCFSSSFMNGAICCHIITRTLAQDHLVAYGSIIGMPKSDIEGCGAVWATPSLPGAVPYDIRRCEKNSERGGIKGLKGLRGKTSVSDDEESSRSSDSLTDSQTDTQTDRYTDRQTDRYTDRHMRRCGVLWCDRIWCLARQANGQIVEKRTHLQHDNLGVKEIWLGRDVCRYGDVVP